MMKNKLNLLVLLFSILITAACTGQKGDMTKDPKYADIANNIFLTKSQTYYYHYTHSDGGKSGNFLSAESEMPNAELKAEFPAGSHVKISQVIEVPQKDGSFKVMVKGKVFSDNGKEEMDYMAMYDDLKSALQLK